MSKYHDVRKKQQELENKIDPEEVEIQEEVVEVYETGEQVEVLKKELVEETPDEEQIEIIAKAVNIRAAPNLNSGVLTIGKITERFTQLERLGLWVKVLTNETSPRTGFVYEAYTREVRPDER